MSGLNTAWELYHAAQNELALSISRRLTSFRPVYSIPSQQREAYSQTVRSAIHELRETQALLGAAAARLQSLELDVLPFLADAESALAPISAVPLEVLRGIILCAVGDPSDTRSVLRVSQVSRAWRGIILDTSELFTHADWDHWHLDLIRTWNGRAKQRRVAVTLMPIIFETLFPTAPQRPSTTLALSEVERQAIKDELFLSLSKCSALSLTIACGLREKKTLENHVEAIASACISLRDLSIISLGFSFIELKLDWFPSIKRLHLKDVDIVIESAPQLRYLICNFDAWRTPLDKLTSLSHLTSLTIFNLIPLDLENEQGSMSFLHLEALEELEIRLHQGYRPSSLHLLFRVVIMPNVEKFTVNGMRFSESEERFIWKVLANAMPRIHSLTLKRDRIGYWPLDIHMAGLWDLDQEGEILLPGLTELRLLGRDVGHLLHSIHLFTSARRGNITHLTLPPREEFEQHEVETWEALQELVPHFSVEAVPHFLPLYASASMMTMMTMKMGTRT
ncbi:hypothetical protein DL93DRAFT_1276412 [Clavulina sp. PMI_390]|nr:hypothetical protein DL93DRAFT_1276412 [Clavulina sp. PMI_390]